MFAKRLIEKAVNHRHSHQHKVRHGNLKLGDLDFRVAIHNGIPSTASILAFDPIQRLLAIGTLDGRIKVIGGDGIEGLLISPKQLAFKNLEFLQNQGFLVSISNDNDLQVWNLESRCLACSLQWESNITAFSVISGSHYMYIGDEYGFLSVLKYDAEEGKVLQLPFHMSPNALSKAAEFTLPDAMPIVGLLLQPCSSGNRVLIAYENGLIILLDVSEAHVLFVGGGKDLELKDGLHASLPENMSDQHIQEKEISALCWASSNGSILAVGYVDGDILLWNTSSAVSTSSQQTEFSSRNIVKIQLSSAERRLPVIVLHWSLKDKSHSGCDGELFIYGGDEIGSEEVLTILTLEWSSGMESVRCSGRVDIALTGFFADMILLPRAGATGGSKKVDLFVLTNPGELQLYDDDSLSASLSRQERKASVSAMRFPVVVPTVDPTLTFAKLIALPISGNSSKILSEIASATKVGSTKTPAGCAKWPLTGGVPSQLSFTKESGVERLFIAGYKDGSVRIWDATYPVLSLICIFDGEAITVADSSAPVSNLDLCFPTLSLAVGDECGVVRVYNLSSNSDQTNMFLVTETKREVKSLTQGKGPHCTAVFSLVNSPVRVLQFANSGAKVAAGFESGHVAVLHTPSSSVLFCTDCVAGSPVVSMTWKDYTSTDSIAKSPKSSETKTVVNPTDEIIFMLTKDAKVNIIDSTNGSMINPDAWHLKKESIAISMYVIGDVAGFPNEYPQGESSMDMTAKEESMPDMPSTGSNSHENEHGFSFDTAHAGERLLESLVLLCCEDSLRLYSTKDLIQGNNKPIHKTKHKKPCCWASIIKKAEKVCGLVLLFQTGVVEIRSIPDLELVQESSLMSILRWSFKASMDKMMSSDNNGQITLVNGHELVFLSLLSGETAFRNPESFPCLHDKVLAAAADAAFSFSSSNQKKKQGTGPGIMGGIIRGIKGGKNSYGSDDIATAKSNFTHLEDIFLNSPFSESSPAAINDQDPVELNIDDIEIDEPSTSAPFQRKKETERQKLLGASDDVEPRMRTPEEIIAQYRKTGDASSAAANARNKLVERQEKLERISRQTEELRSGAEDFASMANELVKVMEARNAKKWWHI
ncbi:uncharacterized protein LOC119992709 isoform X1 [Tripterygium wilfordii]|nr:uncharacterized protein LOC119992709 isoform X1 [Tripterygium wilfordii]